VGAVEKRTGLKEGRMIGCVVPALKRVLCLGAHSDDVEIGCGGTILKLISQTPGLEFLWFVASADEERRREAHSSARDFLKDAAGAEIQVANFRESYFPEQWGGLKREIEKLRSRFAPDLIFTHYREDRHQDHRTISELTWTTFRNHLILEYEVPKYDGDLGQPNLYVPFDAALCARKTDALLKHFTSQTSKHWFRRNTFEAIARIRGIECAAEYAEAYHCRKIVF
jgi:LmbE family N-acetylglucosaminyl deacetylase